MAMNCFHPQAAGACAAFILVSAIVISCGHSVVHALESGPRKLEFYLHERTVAEPGYEATDVLAAMPSGNASYFSFGNLGWAEHVIREGKLLTLDTGSYNGTLIVSDWNYDVDSNEWAIVGGTHNFRMATGYAVNRIVYGGPDAPYTTYKWEVFLLYT
ncbi:hypothetical protein AXG93_163s1050 [Marchantia polymorpha subsp. ruderalis]|uniref:Dirigent protein n=1 Tax=Marchantia polymorpha subsp. ruderalis TaxID=1480154 RepID=A0A176VEW4_MARPO|nr:hypothetical protein AXG93_163s1050 [Marchantia polymorpha subsp. ruderalis]